MIEKKESTLHTLSTISQLQDQLFIIIRQCTLLYLIDIAIFIYLQISIHINNEISSMDLSMWTYTTCDGQRKLFRKEEGML